MSSASVHVALAEWGTVDPATHPAASGFYVEGSDAEAIAGRLGSAGILHIENLRGGVRIRATSYVGRLRLGNLVVTVHPKLQGARLLTFLRYAYRLRDLHPFEAVTYGVAPDSFPDLVIAQLALEAEDLIARGLPRAYVRTTEDLVSPRGRVDIAEVVRRGAIRDRLPCVHFPRRDDTHLNRVLLAGMHLAARITTVPGIGRTLHRLAAALADTVTPIRLDLHSLARAERSLTRLTTAYAPALRLIRLLLESEGVALDDGTVVALQGFLFDMNALFQAVISRFVAENLHPYTVRSEYHLKGMLAFDPEYNPWQSRSPSPRPDIAVFENGQVATYLDAKYMDLWERRGVGRDVLYQLAIYAMSQPHGGTAVILYPTTAPSAREARIAIADPTDRAAVPRAHVVARPVYLETLHGHLISGNSRGAVRSRTAYASYLAFGSPSGSHPLAA